MELLTDFIDSEVEYVRGLFSDFSSGFNSFFLGNAEQGDDYYDEYIDEYEDDERRRAFNMHTDSLPV
jgi:hypothetical protein